MSSYLTFPPLPRCQDSGAVYLCCTCPGVAPGRRYLLSLPCGARTFLRLGLSAPSRDCPTYLPGYYTFHTAELSNACFFMKVKIVTPHQSYKNVPDILTLNPMEDIICKNFYVVTDEEKSMPGCGEVWYRAWFGSKRPWVRIPPLRPKAF